MGESKQEPQNSEATPKPPTMNSLSDECNILKQQYDECFNTWFSERFLKGHKDLAVCDPYMKLYSDCVRRAMVVKGIDMNETDKDVLKTEEEKKP